MTLDERAHALIEAMYQVGGRLPREAHGMAEQAIAAAVDEEREAIREIVDELNYKHGAYNAAIRHACAHIDEKIRARCNTSATQISDTKQKMG